ncbi:MAG: RNA methyltransferase [Anaerolineales bacterium]|nr:RNA methyltransferase [Anaerolineales bacterium]
MAEENRFAALCPRCKSPVQVTSTYQASTNTLLEDKDKFRPHPHIEGFLDNIRSAWNVGSMLRTADGIGIRRMHLCGITPTPENPKVTKTALGSEFYVPWEYYPNGLEAAVQLKKRGYRLWALEGVQRAVPLNDLQNIGDRTPVVLIVGNENFGIDPEILEQCDNLLYIPMSGDKQSYNVAVAFGIASFLLSLQ